MQNLLVFGGKGGVGKSSISTATAVYLAEEMRDKKVLLISFDIAHNLSDLFNQEIGNKITGITENLYAIEPDPDKYAEKYAAKFASKLRELLKSTFIVGSIPELNKFVNATFQAKTLPLALKNSIFFQSLLDAEHPLEVLPEKSRKVNGKTLPPEEGSIIPEIDIIVADFPPTGNMLALFEIPENHMQQLVKYSLEMVSTIRAWSNTMKTVGKALNPFSWGKIDQKREHRRNIAQEILDMLHRGEQRAARISALMKGIGSLRLVTIPEKPSFEEIKRAEELTRPYITLDAVNINRLLPESLVGTHKFIDNLLDTQKHYVHLIEDSFIDFPIWKSRLLDEEPIGIPGLLQLAKEVYGDTSIEKILNPKGRILTSPTLHYTKNPIRITKSHSD